MFKKKTWEMELIMNKEEIKNILLYLVAFVLFMIIIYGAWNLARIINYSLTYEDMVKETICEMVKTENLKETC